MSMMTGNCMSFVPGSVLVGDGQEGGGLVGSGLEVEDELEVGNGLEVEDEPEVGSGLELDLRMVAGLSGCSGRISDWLVCCPVMCRHRSCRMRRRCTSQWRHSHAMLHCLGPRRTDSCKRGPAGSSQPWQGWPFQQQLIKGGSRESAFGW